MTLNHGRKDAPDTEESLRHWLALLRAPGIGPSTLLPLIEEFPEPEALFRSRASIIPEKLARYLKNPDWEAVESDQDWLNQPDNHLLPINSPDYPELLREIPDPPVALFVHGNLSALSLPQLAMVGSRNPTNNGRQTAKDFAAFLSHSGLAITSGLATGIDAASHEGALLDGGVTLAIAGTGLDRVYPAKHRQLAHQISEHGALISEFPLNTPPRPGHFPRRNRLISGLSVGTLVVEAALKSGSLITARMALEQGREVFAIPGSIHNPLAKGCHALIRQGAKLVETAGDILEELAPLLTSLITNQQQDEPPKGSDKAPDPEYQRLLEAMEYDPITVDQLILKSGLSPQSVSSMLLLLELEGHVSSVAGGQFVRSGTANN